ncbi:MAG: hypothetical protein QNJ68_02835 [Microcoleaceae cyanobacterium MO_207.B10]|nr:hypothetical protein [Microcoleaceae cyanobacterium MO_207.B10]
MTQKCTWNRYIYNGCEPDNTIKFYGIEADTPGKFVADELTFFGAFNDGPMSCSIIKMEDGRYRAIVDEKETYYDSFEEAFWEKMPAYLTHPDHEEEGELFVHEE